MTETTPVPVPETGDPAPEASTSPVDYQSEAEKWKSLSRKNERDLDKARLEIDRLKQAQMSDGERAIEQAKQDALRSATEEFGRRLASAELRAQAAAAGRVLSDEHTDFIDLGKFVDDSGSPNTDLISQFVSGLPAADSPPRFSQNVGLGPQGNSGPPQLSRADLQRMTPAQILQAREAGQLDALMGGEM